MEAVALSGGQAKPGGAPEIAVVVPTRDRPLRLRWLLNALEEQDLESERFEVVVAHNSSEPETEVLLRSHPLARRGVLRHLRLPAGPGPGVLRNAAWRAARAPLIAFTDDDCRPPAGWLRAALEAARAHPGAIVQGATRPDPDELAVFRHAPHARSQVIDPPVSVAQTCNIVYPRALLERVGGFDEDVPFVGEDADLAFRARAAGARLVGAPEALTYHAVDAGLLRRLRSTRRWRDMALLVRRHPELRAELPLFGLAWKTEHVRTALALAGLAAGRRSPLTAAVLAAPYLAGTPRRYGTGPRGLTRALLELPGRFVIDVAELAALLEGSARHRTFLL